MNRNSFFADMYAEWDDESTISAIEHALAQVGDVIRIEADPNLPAALLEARPDIVFNVAEGWGGPSRESHVPAFCEFWGIPYTGSGPLTLAICLHKARAKQILCQHGIPTPPFLEADRPADVGHAFELPAVVKPLHEGSSKGITGRSLCHSWIEVETEVARIVDRYDQPAIVEQFLGGREFTTALLGNDSECRVLPLVEIDFETLPAGSKPIYGYEAKWIWDRPEEPLEIFQCPAQCHPALQSRIEEIALEAFHALGCRDWARIDIRCHENGTPHILEVNPLPGILPDPDANSCFPKAARACGLSFDQMIQTVLLAAAARYELPITTH